MKETPREDVDTCDIWFENGAMIRKKEGWRTAVDNIVEVTLMARYSEKKVLILGIPRTRLPSTVHRTVAARLYYYTAIRERKSWAVVIRE